MLGYCSSPNLTKSSFVVRGATSNSESGGLLLPLLVILHNVANKQKKSIKTTKNGAVSQWPTEAMLGPKETPLPPKVIKQCFPKHKQENRGNRYLWANATPLMQKWNYKSRL